MGGDIRLPAETVSFNEDADFPARTAECKQQLPQSFYGHSASRATFITSAVVLKVFGRLSESYYHSYLFLSSFINC
jgi:hypothetical protein